MSGLEITTLILGVFTIILTVTTIVITIWLFKLSNKIDRTNFWYRTIFIQDNGLINKVFNLKSDIEVIFSEYIGKSIVESDYAGIIKKLKHKFRIFDENFYIVEVMSKEVSRELEEISLKFRDEIINYVDCSKNIDKYIYIKITTDYLKKMLIVIYKYSKDKI